MITPAYSPTATERVLPRLALDFTTAIADPRVATTRAGNTATRFNQNGLIEIVSANLPRFDFSPTALTCQGQLIEETRANLFLNSLIDGTNLSTQSVTLSAVAYTLSFYGSGSVAVSGGHSATVAGVGDFPNRKTYTFTPTAGSSTFTVSGDVKFAQLETGSFPTSFIPTAATSVTRNADVVAMTGTNFSDWWNNIEGAFVVESSTLSLSKDQGVISIGDPTLAFGARSSYTALYQTGLGGNIGIYVATGGAVQFQATPNPGQTANSPGKLCVAYKTNNTAASVKASANSTDTSVTLPTPTQLSFGSLASGWAGATTYLNGHISKFMWYTPRLTNAEVRAFSK